MVELEKRTIALVVVFFLIGVGVGFPMGRYTAPTMETTETDAVAMPRLTGEIPLGAIVPFSGDAEYMFPAMEIALEEVNEYVEKLGLNVTFKLLFEDAEFSDEVALEKFESLAERGVKVVLGLWWSSQVEACKPYADEHHILIISSASTAPSLAIPDDYVFRLVPMDVTQARALARMLESMGIKAVVVLQKEDIWGKGLAEGLIERFEELDGVVVDHITYPPERFCSSAELARAADKVRTAIEEYGEGKVAVEFVAMAEVEFMLRQALEHPLLLSVPWFGSDGYVRVVSLVEEIPDLALKTCQYCPLSAVTESPMWKAFADEFYARTGLELRHYECESYDSVWVAALGILQAGVYDADVIKRALPDVCSSYFGTVGWLKLDENGDKAVGDYDIWGVTEEDGVIA